MTTTNQRLWSVEEYHRMAETGILDPEERVELIEGQIIPMSPKKPPHSAVTKQVADYLRNLLVGVADIRIQEPIHLNSRSEPEPDIAVVQIDTCNYIDHHPIPAEVFLVIEVADTTLKLDCKKKSAVYSKARIADYWVIDVNEQRVFVFREPGAKAYRQEAVKGLDTTLTLLAFPDAPVYVTRFFPC